MCVCVYVSIVRIKWISKKIVWNNQHNVLELIRSINMIIIFDGFRWNLHRTNYNNLWRQWINIQEKRKQIGKNCFFFFFVFFIFSKLATLDIYFLLAWTSIKLLLLTYLNFDLSMRWLVVLFKSKLDTIGDVEGFASSFVDPCSYWLLLLATLFVDFTLTILYLERWNLSNAGSYLIAKWFCFFRCVWGIGELIAAEWMFCLLLRLGSSFRIQMCFEFIAVFDERVFFDAAVWLLNLLQLFGVCAIIIKKNLN